MNANNVHAAAEHLQQYIPAPPGMVNTLAFFDEAGPLIRVLVDRSMWDRLPPVPEVFEGYRVSVEPKGATYLFDH
jgi:hypothetical protein